jgi:small subunit ribosomal protein S5
MEAAGIKDILAKSLGSKNTMNIVKSVFAGLEELFDAKELATNRGKSLKELWG